MTEIKLQIEPLTQQGFAPYGDVIEINDANQIISINQGLADRHHDLAEVDVNDENGHAIISIIDTQKVCLPLRISVMERHPLGSQAFMPIGDNPYIVVVTESGEFDYQQLKGFLARPNQGVNYAKGVWHHSCMSLNGANQFLVVDRGGQGPNCDFISVPDSVNITIDSEDCL